MDGPRSLIFDQSENRLHVQKALLVELLAGGGRPVSEALYERYKDALRRGHAASLRGRFDEAIAAYREAASIAPDRALPQASLGGHPRADRPDRRGARGLRRRPRPGARGRGVAARPGRDARHQRPARRGRRRRSTGSPTMLDREGRLAEAMRRRSPGARARRVARPPPGRRGAVARLQASRRHVRRSEALRPGARRRSTGPARASARAADRRARARPAPRRCSPPPAVADRGRRGGARRGRPRRGARRATRGGRGAARRSASSTPRWTPATRRWRSRRPIGDVHLRLAELYLDRGWRAPAADKLVLLGRLAELTGDDAHAGPPVHDGGASGSPTTPRLAAHLRLTAVGARPTVTGADGRDATLG